MNNYYKIFRLKKSCLLLSVIFLFYASAGAEQIHYRGGKNYTLVERTDLRRYDNNRYVGLLSREVRSFIASDNGLYEGSFYVDETTKHKNMSVAAGLHNSIPSTFRIDDEGVLTMLEDCGYPSFRSFPAFTKESIKIGDSWTSRAERAVDPLNKGVITRLNMEVLYTYTGDEVFKGEEVYVLSAKWATRYGGAYVDEQGDPDLHSATGKHSATMYISKQTGYALVVRDYIEETFVYKDRDSYTFKGTISLFTEYPPAVDTQSVMPVIQKVAEELGDQIKVDQTAGGIRLTMNNLRFKANSAELLPGQENLLTQIAKVLKQVPKSQVLVEGHTASTGQPNAELSLSIERANSIANALVQSGIEKDRFICQGRGSSRPVASNETPEGKALNRRVEITILSE